MDTPGFKEEEKTKPAETKEIEGTASLISYVVDSIKHGSVRLREKKGLRTSVSLVPVTFW